MGRRRISGAQLARQLNVSAAWVSYRLTGTQPIDLNDLDRIAAVLDVDVVTLLPQREGRLITVGGTSGTTGRESKPWNLDLPKRPQPNGPPSRNTPAPSTRRTGRLGTALAVA
jgi:transcriptional regulator with XRE-family HTH domain